MKLSDYILGHKNGAVGNFKAGDPAIKQAANYRSVYQWQQENPARNKCGCGGIISFVKNLMVCRECGFEAHIIVSAAEVFGFGREYGMNEHKLRVPAPLQFTPSCLRCGAQGVAEHKPTCPNFTPPSAGKGELK